jgi:hypothetical protein
MTRLEPGKIITRETAATETRKQIPLVVALHDRYMTIRLKGHRIVYPISYGGVF